MQSLDQFREPQDPQDAFERRLEDALATPPEVAIPPDFAERLAAMVPTRPVVRVSGTLYARRSMVLSTLLLLAALLLLAWRPSGGVTLLTMVEWIFCAQLSLVALLSVSPWSPWRSRG